MASGSSSAASSNGEVAMAKTALITGANRGIGQQLATTLAKDGWDVLVGARDKQKGDAAAARMRKLTGGRLKGVELDVTSDASVASAAQKLRDGAIKIDALIKLTERYCVIFQTLNKPPKLALSVTRA